MRGVLEKRLLFIVNLEICYQKSLSTKLEIK